jgi:hypothetical protein
MENTTFAQQAAAWKNGEYALYPHCNDFYDWFCKDNSLENRANKLKGLAKRLVARFNLDPNRVYVFFKNNCPMSGPLYDSLSICDRESGDVLLWATPKSGHNGNAELYMVKEGKEISAPTFTEILEGLKK